MNHHLKSVIDKLSSEGRTALNSAVSYAATQHHIEVTAEHLLLAIIHQESTLLESLGKQTGLQVSQLFIALQKTVGQVETCSKVPTPVFSHDLVQWLMNAWMLVSTRWGDDTLSPIALVASLFDEPVGFNFSPCVQQTLHCDQLKARQLLQTSFKAPGLFRATTITGTALAKYTRNLSELARRGELDPVLGRESEIRQMVDILLRRRQNNPILTGEPGVGKTALVEGLALRINDGTVPATLKSMEVLTLDFGLLQAGASVKGEFENRLQSILKEVASSPQPIILFIDEAHTLIGAGGQIGQNDAANLLKPALARGELRVIAATTWGEYKKYVEKDAALARRFQVVKVTEPDLDIATSMLRAMVPAMSRHHGITVLENAIHAAVKFSSRYLVGRQLPEKSVSLLDTACARVAVSQTHEPKEIEAINVQLNAIHCEIEALQRENSAPERLTKLIQQATMLQTSLNSLLVEWQRQHDLVQQLLNSKDTDEIALGRETLAAYHQQHPMVFECVDATCVADVVSDWTGIPLGRMLEKENNQLDTLFSRLEQQIVGQEYALEKITQQIRINRAGMGDPLKPTGVYMLTGPSGTGKTETSLALAELLFGGDQGLVTINMSEYQEAHSVSGLKGSPPGYVGYGQGGILTEAVRRNPYCVILLDEVEKAHPDVMELFYQIFDKGMLEDAEGQKVNFRNTLIIMTSNLASDVLVRAFENGEHSAEALIQVIRPEFDKVFSPALMGRITLIPYLPLTSEALELIITMKLQRLCQRYQHASKEKQQLTFTNQVVSWIAERCKVRQSGARDIDQMLNEYLLPLLASQVLREAPVTQFRIEVCPQGLTLLNEEIDN
ncbi:type VI secretion system ATPase TssH [Citrobacter portucalensis]|uniref:type VI secretion system ATPase TssH n=1 Tax=Citrobacter portucalensis TaxID=1639133 RepID=UPI00226AFE9C|nr:type VI secretion system ATPase TssH [Citrobacter portucalensis]MCX9039111.1 type VI secretion system ATPase TssH [Citrobacter portucalensis]